MAKNNKIIKYHKVFHFDIGFIFFFIIIIYVLANIVYYFVSEPVAVYEVQQGTIATNNIFRGLILRDETVEYSSKTGYINYYVKPGSKVGVKDIICSIDTTGDISKKIDSAISDGSAMDSLTVDAVLESLDGFSNTYNESDYSGVYTYKRNLASTLNQKLSTNALHILSEEVTHAEANNTFFTVKSTVPGIISYNVDGYEDVKLETLRQVDFDSSNVNETKLGSITEVNMNSPIYKRINSEDWNVVIDISDQLAEELKDTSAIKVRFLKDDYTVTTGCSVVKRDNSYFLNLDMKRAMVRYVDLRFVDVELVINTKSGLKIPNSSITSKKFFAIPKSYFSIDAEGNNQGILVKNTSANDDSVKLVKPTIYGENDTAYFVDENEIGAGAVIQKNDSQSTYVAGTDTVSIPGVYNVNKGYAVFKQIDIISENDDYTIINMKTKYGISLYDHIALDGSKVKENQTIVN